MSAITRLAARVGSVAISVLPALSQVPRLEELHRMLPGPIAHAGAIATADFDGDGSRDVFVGNAGQDWLFFNDGEGIFADATNHLPSTPPTEVTTAVAIGDVDGDGDVDMLLASSSLADQLLLNDGTGRFSDASSNLPGPFSNSRAAALGDVDGDGDLDAAIGCSGAAHRLYLNDGSGHFADASTQLPMALFESNALAFGDADGDGDLDLFLGSSSAWPNQLYANDGNGVFSNTLGQLPPTSLPNHAVSLGDVDGDGDLDVLLANFGSPTLLLNNGTGHFSAAIGFLPTGLIHSKVAALTDVDSDGDLDALLAPLSGELLLRNDGAGHFTSAPGAIPIVPDATVGFGPLDADGDGDTDLVLIADGSQNRLLLNDGTGEFTDVTSPIATAPALAMASGDLDGDRDLDLLTHARFGVGALYLNDGTGLYSAASESLPPLPYDGSEAIALGDVDNDGDLDAFLATSPFPSKNCGAEALLLNDGGARFIDASAQLPGDCSSSTDVALADFDLDGDLDALVGNFMQNRLYVNDGSGHFIAGSGQLPPADYTNAVAIGDVDLDGDLDAVLGRGLFIASAQNALYLNDGSGTFADGQSQLPQILGYTRDVALGDVDGDGDLDVYFANGPSATANGQDRLCLNDGTAHFSEAAGQLPAENNHTAAVDFGDVDLDGDLDLLLGISDSSGPSTRLYLNNGQGSFSDASASLPYSYGYTLDVMLRDLDFDGDLDALTIGSGRTRVLSNLSRQLAWRGIPRIGKGMWMDLFGAPGAPWRLYLSRAEASIPLPPLGVLRIDRESILREFSGTFDARGRASVRISVPHDVALVGKTLYWQAAVGTPQRLTTLERTTFTDL